jgi:butyryl-CoA dehydrogenase
VLAAFETTEALTRHLVGLGDAESTLLHSVDYLDLFGTLVVAWMWLLSAAAAREALSRGAADPGFYEGKLCAAQYWIRTELPRIDALAALCRDGEDSYARVKPGWL